MKSIFRGGIVFFAVAALLIGAAVWYVSGVGESREIEQGRVLRARQIASRDAAKAKKEARRIREGRRSAAGARASELKIEKPNISLSSGDDAKLTEEMRKLYQELQQALDDEDKQRVFALVHKLQSMKEWPDGIPQSVKMHALDALAWFGADGFSEGVGFLADSDPEVVSEAVDKFEEMLSDFDLGDRGVSEILKQIVKVVHDHDALDTFYMELNNMRDTVKAETALAILDSKNPDAISVFKENMEFIFGDADAESEITTREDIEKFYEAAVQANKDDPEQAADDEEFYGPPKD